MAHLKQLDEVLEFLNHKDRSTTLLIMIKPHFKDISEIHLQLILNKLFKDGNIGKSNDLFPYYWITYDGIMFLSYGGYRGEDKARRKAIRRTDIVDYGIIFAGVGAVLSAAYLFGSALIDWIYSCYCY